jgi:hypothetical protein
MRRLAVRRHDERLLQGRGATVHHAGPNERMPLELDGQGFQKGVALQRWIGAAAAWTAANSSSLRLSGMGGRLRWARAHRSREGCDFKSPTRKW